MACKIRIRNIKKFGPKGQDYAEVLDVERKAFGQFYDIKISTKKNRRRSVYFRTLIHELVHVAFNVVEKLFGWKFTADSEHDFIERIEEAVLVHWHVLRRKKK